MKRRTAIVTLLLALGMVTTLPRARATEVDTILLSGQVVMRIRAGVNGLSPVDRGDAVRSRLVSLLAWPGLSPASVRVQQAEPGGEAVIFVGDEALIRVDRTLAEGNSMDDPLRLATVWARNLRRVLPQAVAEARRVGPEAVLAAHP